MNQGLYPYIIVTLHYMPSMNQGLYAYTIVTLHYMPSMNQSLCAISWLNCITCKVFFWRGGGGGGGGGERERERGQEGQFPPQLWDLIYSGLEEFNDLYH